MSEADQSQAGIVKALSSQEVQAIETEVSHLPDRESAAIEALRIVQEARGWVSDESLAAIARQLEMSTAALDSIATFYNLIFRQPVGRHVVMMCDSVSCYVMGCNAVREALCTHLNIGLGETTPDGRITVLPIVCLGACDRAPVMTIDDELVCHLDPDTVIRALERFE